MNQKADDPVLRIHGTDTRGRKYAKIADVHKQLIEAKYKALTVGAPYQLEPGIVLHLEESLAFLAEELLICRSLLEGESAKLKELAEWVHSPSFLCEKDRPEKT